MKRLYVLILLIVAFVANRSYAAVNEFGVIEPMEKYGVTFNTELTSAYLYHGQYCGGLSVQPSIELKVNHFHFINWWNIGAKDYTFREFNPEVDLVIYYLNGPLYFGSKYVNVFSDRGTFNVFFAIDPLFFSENHSLLLKWDTRVFGENDYDPCTGVRVYTSYFVCRYTYYGSEYYLVTDLGFTPWASYYSDYLSGCRMVNFTVQYNRIYNVNGIRYIPYVKLSLNPCKLNTIRDVNMAVGCDINVNLYKRK